MYVILVLFLIASKTENMKFLIFCRVYYKSSGLRVTRTIASGCSGLGWFGIGSSGFKRAHLIQPSRSEVGWVRFKKPPIGQFLYQTNSNPFKLFRTHSEPPFEILSKLLESNLIEPTSTFFIWTGPTQRNSLPKPTRFRDLLSCIENENITNVRFCVNFFTQVKRVQNSTVLTVLKNRCQPKVPTRIFQYRIHVLDLTSFHAPSFHQSHVTCC